MVIEETKCRICKGDLEVVLDLGSIYPSSFLRDDEKVSEDSKVPMVLAQCKECGLVQLKHTLELDSMYRQYWYCSSLNKSMISSLKEIADEIETKGYLKDFDLVLDIGCNDGSLLDLFTKNLVKVGFDPALNIKKPNCLFINDYFTADKYFETLHSQNLKAKVVTAIAMFYDLPDPHKFVQDVVSVLQEDGVFVVQLTDLYSMMKINAFDNICSEHIEYYKLSDIKSLMESEGLEIIDVSYNKVNGGSVRVTSSRRGVYPVSQDVDRLLNEEIKYFESHPNIFEDLKKVVEKTKKRIHALINMISKGVGGEAGRKKIFILGASTKGNTLLQVCGITDKDIPYAGEVNKDKFGLRTVGSNIKIISEDELFSMLPEYLLVLPWHFLESLKEAKKIKNFMEAGGKLVVPLPEFKIYSKTGEWTI